MINDIFDKQWMHLFDSAQAMRCSECELNTLETQATDHVFNGYFLPTIKDSFELIWSNLQEVDK